MHLIDTHAHLDDEQFASDLPQVVARANEAGIETIICVGTDVASSSDAIRLAEEHLSIKAAVGIQPNHTAEAQPDAWERICSLAGHPQVVALGETGLDSYWDFAPMAVQKDYFDRHLRLGQERDLPVIVHCRDCNDEVVAMLSEAAARGPVRGLIHSFSGDQAMADACLELGLYISFSGMVTYRNKKFEPLRKVAAGIPRDRLLLETDSPYLIPHPLRGKQKRNEPALVAHTAAALAQLRGQSPQELAQETTNNARRLFAHIQS
ncbi:MAG: TatD family hydrolase [Pirellulales bacterium]|nr:TatD family hydrolase [Pirellulales bacterium]